MLVKIVIALNSFTVRQPECKVVARCVLNRGCNSLLYFHTFNMCQSQNNSCNRWVFDVGTFWCDFLSIPLLLRLRVCNPSGSGLWGGLPDPRCDQAKPSQQEVPLLHSALPALCLWAGHAPGPASVLCGRPRVHRADARLGWHRHGDGRCRVSALPVSGIYPKPVSVLGSHIDVLWTGECLPVTSWFLKHCKFLKKILQSFYNLLNWLHGFNMVWENLPSLGFDEIFPDHLDYLKNPDRNAVFSVSQKFRAHFSNKGTHPTDFELHPYLKLYGFVS